MTTNIRKWGNSLALRIPKAFAQEVHLESGAIVELSVRDGELVVTPVRKRGYDLKALLSEVSDENLHGELDTGAALGREAW